MASIRLLRGFLTVGGWTAASRVLGFVRDVAIAGALDRAGVAGDEVSEVIMGQILTAGAGQNPARQAGLGAGLPSTLNAVTVNKVCGSGLQAVMHAATHRDAGATTQHEEASA